MEFEPTFSAKAAHQRLVQTSTPGLGNTGSQDNIAPPNVPDAIHQELKELFQQARELPKTSPRRRKLIDRLIVRMQQSNKLWTDKQNPWHEDAASETWIYVVRKLNGECGEDYDPDKGSPITLWNQAYKRKLTELSQGKNKQMQWEAQRRVYPQRDSQTGQWQDPIDAVATPEPRTSELEEAESLIQADPTGRLTQSRIRRDRPEVTVKAVALEIIRRVKQGEDWTLQQLANHFDVPEGTMNSFWSQHCKPRLRELGQAANNDQEGKRIW